MKKILCFLLAAVMLLALCACGGAEKSAANGGEAAAEPDAAPAAAAYKAVSGRLSGCRVTILSAERFTDQNGRGAVRFYFDFTNSGSTITAADEKLSLLAEQNGSELQTASASYADDVPEFGNFSRRIEPDVTIRCVAEFSYSAVGGELRFTVSDAKGASIAAVFDPQSLPGQPGTWIPEAVDNPRFFRNYASEKTTDDAKVVILGAKLQASDPAYGYAGVIQVYVDYTNLESGISYFESDYSLTAYQDGIELDTCTPAEKPDTYGNGYVDLVPNDTIMVSKCWGLRSDSPVEIVVTEWRPGTVLCADVFPVQ